VLPAAPRDQIAPTAAVSPLKVGAGHRAEFDELGIKSRRELRQALADLTDRVFPRRRAKRDFARIFGSDAGGLAPNQFGLPALKPVQLS
jgi:hypothetical protein